jgi:hypothetical protein
VVWFSVIRRDIERVCAIGELVLPWMACGVLPQGNCHQCACLQLCSVLLLLIKPIGVPGASLTESCTRKLGAAFASLPLC